MRIINCLIVLLFAQVCAAQQVTRKVKYAPNGDRETYYVLSSDNSTLHGRYQRNGRNIRVEGFYKNGLQDGIWTEYSLKGPKFMRVQGPYKDGQRNGLWTVYSTRKKLKSKGFFQNDQRIGFWRFYNANGELEEEGNYTNGMRNGKWSFYDEQGDLVQEYNYTTRTIVSDVLLSGLQRSEYKIISGADTLVSLLQRPPLYIGGKSKLKRSKIIQFPVKADSVKVEIAFIIDKFGRARDFNIVKRMGNPYDQEALYTVQQLPQAWLPAMQHDQPVEVVHTLTVMFNKVFLKKEPAVFYREHLPVNTLPRNPGTVPWESLPQRYRMTTWHVSGLSPHACKVQIL
jgi:hypothetical protein